jgi:pyruvate dehydrogenase E2 component (dihydrolipoamide acetyltransferase)
LGIDWRRLTGTGRDGRVREHDVRQAASSTQSESNSSAIPVSSRRRTIANRMMASRTQTAPVTLTTRLDATNLVNLRNQFKSASNGSVIPSYQDIVIKLASLALQQHPILAARAEADEWVIPAAAADYHIGFAVDTDDGLVVPVIRYAGALSLLQIAEQSQQLIGKVRSGTLSVSEMQGGVFTITNLGNFGIDAFTPIINLPETAVLGLGRIRREPAVIDNQIVARDQMTLSLTFDHRIVDGAPAARFLQTLSLAIENPSAWLLRGEG